MLDSSEGAGYRPHPVHRFPSLGMRAGYEALASAIERHLEPGDGARCVALDGFSGVRWEEFVAQLRGALGQRAAPVAWFSTDACFLPPAAVARLLAPALTADPVFGRLHRGHLEELWDAAAVARLRAAIAAHAGPVVVYGFGASLIAEAGARIYVDVPKDVGQRRR